MLSDTWALRHPSLFLPRLWQGPTRPLVRPEVWDAPLGTVRYVVFAVNAIEACGAGARVAVHTVSTVGTISAGIAGTFVDVLFTEGSLEARQAVAEGCVDAVGAGTSIVTWV